jgi:L-alanine-DL-glutamate epimerase-like enolase superfamily enzyme
MKIAKIEDLHADAGWPTFSFLKITTDDGLIGWSEFTEGDGSRGLSAVIHAMAEPLIGQDPRPVQSIVSTLYVRSVQAPQGVNSRAIAAIELALLDLKGKVLEVPVYELFGGPVRDASPSIGRIAAPTAYGMRRYGHAAAAHLRRRFGVRRRG